MANPEHVEIVKQGAKAIEEWRESNPKVRLDLVEADLRDLELRLANLMSVNLKRTDLEGAILAGSSLRSADLRGAILASAKLSNADLNHAILMDTNLAVADLDSADLRWANLSWADLTDATVRNANFEKAILNETLLADLDLSRAKGLEEVQHFGPSVIDERTLRKSWPLPEIFLRGVGLSDQYIEYLPSLMGQAIEYYSCFISYSSKDDEFAKRLHADLQAEGVRCWFAPEDLKIGDRFRARIDEAIRTYDKLVLILSRNSMQSEWVESEVEAALERERRTKRTVLFPIRIDDAIQRSRKAWAADIRRKRHIGDFTDWKDHDAYKEAFDRLLRDLKSGAKDGGNGES